MDAKQAMADIDFLESKLETRSSTFNLTDWLDIKAAIEYLKQFVRESI